MRFFLIQDAFTELDGWPSSLPSHGFLWVTTSRRVFEVGLPEVQQHLQRLAGGSLMDLHIADLLNPQLPSQYDYTSWYDLLVFRRLAAGQGTERLFLDEAHGTASSARQALAAIDTSPVGFAVFDRVLLTVHPADCSVRDFFEARLSQMIPPTPPQATQASAASQVLRPATEAGANGGPATSLISLPRADSDANLAVSADTPADLPGAMPGSATEGTEGTTPRFHEGRGSTSRLPPNPADLMLRIVNHMVDSYLDLRRLLTRQFAYLQQELFSNRNQFSHWQALLDARNTLHMLEDTCEDQRSAVQEWIDALEEWPLSADPHVAREREVLRVRSRDVHEHIERVLAHVRRLESSAESAVQIHFSAQGSRTNDIMRTLTVLTAVFLPLNLITGVFGMNFEVMPLLKHAEGFWLAMLMMAGVAVGLVWWFRRRRYIGDGPG
ncbi:MAG: magnesium transporter CorA family protein [Proteobacteria bacterium]|uniref:magnesium transporter CorA family protein n=1 Tax=Aquabacterium sp. TaxID=1872578 RepID=UPI0035C67362|nr:magnesium transporter CorA family protein [Pseudomonadota bacterium]